jgi:CRP-like cAMP-binding protein
MMPTEPERLKRFPCFRDLTGEQRIAVAELVRDEWFHPEETLFREGETGAHLYMLVSGEVEILYSISDQGPARVDIVGSDEILGCSTLIEPYTYTSTVRSLSETETLTIDSAALRELMRKDCAIGCSIQKHIIQMLLDRIIDLRLGI